jgi:hypothetical protein
VGSALALGATAAGCRKLSTDISLADPSHLKDRATWTEFDVFDGGCPTKLEMAQSTYPKPLQSQIVAVGDELAPIGELSSGNYGFTVILRQDDCAVVGFGCTNANVKTFRSVNIQINPTFIDADGNLFPQGACVAPLSCQQGVCSEGGAGAAGDAGAAGAAGMSGGSGGSAGTSGAAGKGGAGGSGGSGGAAITPPPMVTSSKCGQMGSAGAAGAGSGACTMQLVGWVELPKPQSKDGQVAGPAVVATKTGFIVAYDELSSDGAKRRLVTLPVGLDGCAATASTADVDECVGVTSLDPGLGMAWNESAGAGLATFSRAACPAQKRGAGIGLIRFGSAGQTLAQGLIDSYDDPNFPPISFASHSGVARGLGTEEFRVTYTQKNADKKDTTFNFPVQGVNLVASGYSTIWPAINTGGTSVSVSGSSDLVLAQAANVTSDTTPATGIALTNTMGQTKFVFRDAAKELALAVAGSQIALVSKTDAGKLGWALLANDGSEVATGSLADPTPSGSGFDVGLLGTRAIFATGQAAGLALQWNDLSQMSQPVEGSTSLAKGVIPPLETFDGKRVVMATGNGRVIVAWVSHQASTTDAVGGAAVFRCEP